MVVCFSITKVITKVNISKYVQKKYIYKKKHMKKIILFLLGTFVGFAIAAQPPMRVEGQRPLPNQFRDFVDHQQRLSMQRPNIEKKDGKVIITMSEEQFKRMQQMRAAQRYRLAQHRPLPPCSKCEKKHLKHKSDKFNRKS